MTTQQYVGTRSDADGLSTNRADRTTRDGGKVVSQLHGQWVEQSLRSNVYTGVSASAGIALIVPATTGNHPTLWNPSDSDVNISVIRLELSYVSGSNAPTAIEWAAVPGNAGSTHATGAPIATATRVAPVGVIGGAVRNKGIWSPTINTFTVAPAFYRPTGLSLFTGVDATADAPFSMSVDYDGDIVIRPGKAICLCSQAATTTAVFQVAVTWEEVPI